MALFASLAFPHSTRCLRHFAIYNQPWPRRISAHGGTPREESTPTSDASKRVTQKSLPVLDHKLAAAVSASKRTHKEDSHEEDQAAKRRKTDALVVKVKPPGAAARPSTESAPASAVSSHSSVSERTKRKRGRPRLSDQIVNTLPSSLSSHSTTIKVEEIPSKIPSNLGISQPRSTNGRFGRKLRSQQRAAKVTKDPSHKQKSEPSVPTRFSLRRKREDENEEMDELPRKKRSSESFQAQKVLPRRMSMFKGASLVSNPNPLRFALKVWANPVLCDGDDDGDDVSSSSDEEEDDQGPETPEDYLSPPANTVDLVDHEASVDARATILPRARLTFKPSPFTYAKRRWASTGLVVPDTETATAAKGQEGQGEETVRRSHDPRSDVGGDDNDEVCS